MYADCRYLYLKHLVGYTLFIVLTHNLILSFLYVYKNKCKKTVSIICKHYAFKLKTLSNLY